MSYTYVVHLDACIWLCVVFPSQEVTSQDADLQQLPLNTVYTKGLQCVLLAPPYYGSMADVSYPMMHMCACSHTHAYTRTHTHIHT